MSKVSKCPEPLNEIGEGEIIEVAGTRKQGKSKAFANYYVTNGGHGFYSMAWSTAKKDNDGPEEHIQTCKHLRGIRGDEPENFRLLHAKAPTEKIWEGVRAQIAQYKLDNHPTPTKKAKRPAEKKDQAEEKKEQAAPAKKAKKA